MLKRPKPGQDERDLLELQQEFSRDKNLKPAATVIKVRKPGSAVSGAQTSQPSIGAHVNHASYEQNNNSVVSDIIEKIQLPKDHKPEKSLGNVSGQGFPVAEKVKIFEKQIGKSIFATRMLCKREKIAFAQKSNVNETEKMECDSQLRQVFSRDETVSPRDFQIENSFHEENLAKLSQMNEADILNEQNRLLARLGSETIDFLKSRGKNQVSKDCHVETKAIIDRNTANTVSKEASNDALSEEGNSCVEMGEEGSLNDNKNISGEYIWTSDLPQPVATKALPIRFDLNGFIVTDLCEPVNKGLHHHGDNQEYPGYTISELFTLCKSSFPQQKSLALKVLALVANNAKLGCFVSLGINIFQELLNNGFAIVTRYVLDDGSLGLICNAVQALESMVTCVNTYNMFDFFSYLPGYTILAPMCCSINHEEKVKPEELLKMDLVKGLVATNIVARLRYILEVVLPPNETELSILRVLIRLARHSPSSAYSVFKCTRLLDLIAASFLDLGRSSDEKTVLSLQLMTVLAANGKTMAADLLQRGNVRKQLILDICEQFPLSNDGNCNYSVKCASFAAAYKLSQTFLGYALLIDDIKPLVSVILMKCARLQTINLGWNERSSVTEMKLAISFLNFCASAVDNLSLDESFLPFFQDFSHFLFLLVNKWCTELANEKLGNSDFCYLCVSSALKTLNSVISTGYKIPTANLLTSLKIVGFLLNNCLKETDLFTSSLYFPDYSLTYSKVLPEFYYFITKETCELPVCSITRQFFSLIRTCNDFVKEDFLWNETRDNLTSICFTSLEKFKRFSFQFPKADSTEYGLHFINIYLSAAYEMLLFLKQNLSRLHTDSRKCKQLIMQVAENIICLSPTGSEDIFRSCFLDVMFSVDMFTPQNITDGLASLELNTPCAHPNPKPSVINSARVIYSSDINELPPSHEPQSLKVMPHSFVYKQVYFPCLSPLLTHDWIFKPILTDFVNRNDRLVSNDENMHSVLTCLQYFTAKNSLYKNLSSDTVFYHLMTIFFLSPDIFLTNSIQDELAAIFLDLLRDNKFTLKAPDGFSEQYVSLLEHFEAESYGNCLFSNFLLLPMCVRFDVKFRRAVWVEYTNVLKVLRLFVDDLLFPFDWLVEPKEKDEAILKIQRNCLSGDILSRCPVLRKVATVNIQN